MNFPRRSHHTRQWKALLRDILWELEEAGEAGYSTMLNTLHAGHTTSDVHEDLDRYLSAFAYLTKKAKARVVEERGSFNPPRYEPIGLDRFEELRKATAFDASSGLWCLDWPSAVHIHVGHKV